MRLRSADKIMPLVVLIGVVIVVAGCSSSGTRPSPAAKHSSPASASAPTTRSMTSQPATPTVTASSSGATSTAPTPMPDAAGMVAFVRGGKAVDASVYQRGAMKAGQPLTATPGVIEFMTPSGNIACGFAVGSGRAGPLSCDVAHYTYATQTKPCNLNYAPGWVSLTSAGAQRGACLGGPPFAPYSEVLPYGASLQNGTFACRSDAAFLACADVNTGHGFAVNRTTLRTY